MFCPIKKEAKLAVQVLLFFKNLLEIAKSGQVLSDKERSKIGSASLHCTSRTH